MTYIMLVFSLISATGRSIISKAGGERFAGIKNMLGTNILSSLLALIVFGVTLPDPSLITGEMLILALFYAAFSMLSPLLYIVAVGSGNISVCSIIFGCGFLVPTVFGMIYSGEAAAPLFIPGLILIIAAVVLVTGKITRGGLRCIIPATAAMLASGSLGVVQILFSRNHSAELQNEFIFISFLFSLVIASVLFLIFGRRADGHKKPDRYYLIFGIALAVCIVMQNRLNLSLTGTLPAVLMFPVLNGGTIALSNILSAVIFKERFTGRKVCAVIAAVLAILLLNIQAVDERSVTERGIDYLTSGLSAEDAGVGLEHTVIALSKADPENPLMDAYRDNITGYIKQKSGVLHTSRYTEYSRTVIALAAIGEDPTDIGGYDLTRALFDYEKVRSQGVNGSAWALMAIDAAELADGGAYRFRNAYIADILAAVNPDGSFGSLKGSEVDVTAMCLRALAPYCDRTDVREACVGALAYLASVQSESGQFPSSYGEASESVSQVICALAALGITEAEAGFDAPVTLTDALLTYQNPDGGFAHIIGGESGRLATEQAVYALIMWEEFTQNS